MQQMGKAISVLVTIGFSAGAMVLGSGCETDSAKPTKNNVTDVRPIDSAMPAAYQPPLVDTSATIPVASQTVSPDPFASSPTYAANTAPIVSSTPSHTGTKAGKAISTTGEKTHTVKHGETLFSIAKAAYGSGKAWTKIVSANPGVSPSKLKVGQVLVMPAQS